MRRSATSPKEEIKRAPLPKWRLCAGQVSLETLLVFLLFLSLLSIAFTAISHIRDAAERKISHSLSLSSFNEFSTKLAEACSFGSGNVRMARVNGGDATVFAEGRSFFFSAPAFSGSGESLCELEVENPGPSSQFRLENKDGVVHVS